MVVCRCMEPVELPDMSCGGCGRRRLGDDLTATEFQDLTAALTAHFEGLDGGVCLKRVKGRKRPMDGVRGV